MNKSPLAHQLKRPRKRWDLRAWAGARFQATSPYWDAKRRPAGQLSGSVSSLPSSRLANSNNDCSCCGKELKRSLSSGSISVRSLPEPSSIKDYSHPGNCRFFIPIWHRRILKRSQLFFISGIRPIRSPPGVSRNHSDSWPTMARSTRLSETGAG